MDKKILIRKLNAVFCDVNKTDKRYSEIWLSDVDFGFSFQSDQYVLNVRVNDNIKDCQGEISNVVDTLFEKAKEVVGNIWRVAVYANNNRFAHCEAPFMLVYDEDNACK
jgi:hypothetical protein